MSGRRYLGAGRRRPAISTTTRRSMQFGTPTEREQSATSIGDGDATMNTTIDARSMPPTPNYESPVVPELQSGAISVPHTILDEPVSGTASGRSRAPSSRRREKRSSRTSDDAVTPVHPQTTRQTTRAASTAEKMQGRGKGKGEEEVAKSAIQGTKGRNTPSRGKRAASSVATASQSTVKEKKSLPATSSSKALPAKVAKIAQPTKRKSKADTPKKAPTKSKTQSTKRAVARKATSSKPRGLVGAKGQATKSQASSKGKGKALSVKEGKDLPQKQKQATQDISSKAKEKVAKKAGVTQRRQGLAKAKTKKSSKSKSNGTDSKLLIPLETIDGVRRKVASLTDLDVAFHTCREALEAAKSGIKSKPLVKHALNEISREMKFGVLDTISLVNEYSAVTRAQRRAATRSRQLRQQLLSLQAERRAIQAELKASKQRNRQAEDTRKVLEQAHATVSALELALATKPVETQHVNKKTLVRNLPGHALMLTRFLTSAPLLNRSCNKLTKLLDMAAAQAHSHAQ
eukprot:m.152640 g.152640  ORF g.152640 m.152640 type:complete len:517 (+) comp14267_c0_seq2:75-1625(+)